MISVTNISLNPIFSTLLASVVLYILLQLNLEKNVHTSSRNGHLDLVDEFENIDWHNYTQITQEARRKGPGEKGRPVSLGDKKPLPDWMHCFVAEVSDKISVERSVPDTRHPRCKEMRYGRQLAPVSVVVPVFREHWTTLLRTVHSVVNRTPARLLKEVLLVDDGSPSDKFSDKLEAYLEKNLPKVRVLKLPTRAGLMAARQAGARAATADFVVVLDSHCEVNVNWLPPLLDPIARDYRTVTSPGVDIIAYDTFEYQTGYEPMRGLFNWELEYKELPIMPDDKDNLPKPFKSPVMAGGLFAISRRFFFELGGYDEKLRMWGGEQFELSFKIWRCGGQILTAPCSKVGHVYRAKHCRDLNDDGNSWCKNLHRVARLWMDEYQEYVSRNLACPREMGSSADMEKQRKLREQLGCKSFHWYMTQVAFDLTNIYPPLGSTVFFANGWIKSALAPSMCLDANYNHQDQTIQISPCEEALEKNFEFTTSRDIRTSYGQLCLDLWDLERYSPLVLAGCRWTGETQQWRYYEKTRVIQSVWTGLCLEYGPKAARVYLNKCNGRLRQKWTIENVNTEALSQWTELQQVTGPTVIISD